MPENTKEIKESKEEKFVRIASARVTKILEGIELLKNLSSPAYGKSQEQITAMFDAIHAAADDAEKAFAPKTPETVTKKKFTF